MNAQLRLDAEPPVPLKQALDQLAQQWSLRLGVRITVTGNSWAGYRLSPSKEPTDDHR